MRRSLSVLLCLLLAIIINVIMFAADEEPFTVSLDDAVREFECVSGEPAIATSILPPEEKPSRLNVISSQKEPSSASFTSVSYDIGYVGNKSAIWAKIYPHEVSFADWIVSFSASDAEIAKVSFDLVSGDLVRAIVTGVSPGSASIDIKVVSTDGITSFDANCRVYVRAAPAVSVLLDVHEKTFYKGYKFKLTATVNPDNARDNAIVWSSSSEDIVHIDQSGNIMCLKEGAAYISATVGSMYDVCKITVKANPLWLDESDAVKVLPEGASFDVFDGTLVWVDLNDAFTEQKTILKNDDLYGYHITGFYGYEESGEFKNGWKALIKDSSKVEILFDRSKSEVNGEIGIIIISNGAGYLPGADLEKHITVKFSGKNESYDSTGCNFGCGFLTIAFWGFIILLKKNQ